MDGGDDAAARHRALLADLTGAVAVLARRLAAGLADGGAGEAPLGEGESPAAALDTLARAAARLVPLERRALGLEDAGQEADGGDKESGRAGPRGLGMRTATATPQRRYAAAHAVAAHLNPLDTPPWARATSPGRG